MPWDPGGLQDGQRSRSGASHTQSHMVHTEFTSATLNVSITTALLFLVNKLLKSRWYTVASAGDENVPQTAQSAEKLHAATLRTLEPWRC